jgi:hypothetical protein
MCKECATGFYALDITTSMVYRKHLIMEKREFYRMQMHCEALKDLASCLIIRS